MPLIASASARAQPTRAATVPTGRSQRLVEHAEFVGTSGSRWLVSRQRNHAPTGQSLDRHREVGFRRLPEESAILVDVVRALWRSRLLEDHPLAGVPVEQVGDRVRGLEDEARRGERPVWSVPRSATPASRTSPAGSGPAPRAPRGARRARPGRRPDRRRAPTRRSRPPPGPPARAPSAPSDRQGRWRNSVGRRPRRQDSTSGRGPRRDRGGTRRCRPDR